MEPEYIEVPIEKIKQSLPELPKTIGVFNALHESPYCSNIKCFHLKNEGELISFDTEVQVGQVTVNDIKRKERISILFTKDDSFIPLVFALRTDFPEVPHRILFPKGWPCCLCIYYISYDELKITWSPTAFVEDIRNWLKKTAKGELHQNDQPLEPLLLEDQGSIILPNDLKQNELLNTYVVRYSDDKKVHLLVTRKPFEGANSILHTILLLKGQPQTHGVISYTPTNFWDLNSFLSKAGINYTKEITEFLKKIKESSPVLLKTRLLVLITLPKTREKNGEIVQEDIFAFITIDEVSKIGITLGLWEMFKEYNILTDILLPATPDEAKMSLVKTGLLKPYLYFNKQMANDLNKIKRDQEDSNLFAIGLGALGSQVFMNMCRSGFGKWTLLDDDVLLPHNLARHSLTSASVGYSKVTSLAFEANSLLNDESFAFPIEGNIIQEKNNGRQELIEQKILDSNIVLDMSASLAVSRYISNDNKFSVKRLISCFLNPKGTDLVILGEDKNKEYKLDFLEVCYYRELIHNKVLANHFNQLDDDIRYSASCRDLAGRIPQGNLALYAASASMFLKKFIYQEKASATIWKLDEDKLNISRYDIPISKSFERIINDWTIVYDVSFLNKIDALRKSKLPKETGGVLIGTYDMERKKVFLSDTIIPTDNSEYPTFFYRGIGGLKEELGSIRKITSNMLTYVGEWHSHPKGFSIMPSTDDMKLLAWLSQNMSVEGLPALMLILGDNSAFTICFAE